MQKKALIEFMENADRKNTSLLKYAGMAGQFLASIAIGLFGGSKLDKWLGFKTPLFIWVLPLLIIVGLMIAIIKDTGKKK